MKLLISAFAIQPNRGSEHAVGWNSMIKLSKSSHEVVLVTRFENKIAIESELEKLNITNIKFEYFELPKYLHIWRINYSFFQLYVYLWEILLFFFLFKRYNRNEFDISQRITYVSYKFPTLIWYFGKKFIYGPISGGERFPFSFLKIFSFRGKVFEVIRMITQRLSLFDPFILLSLWKANEIIAVTEDTKTIFPTIFHRRITVKPVIEVCREEFITSTLEKSENTVLELLYVGNLLEWKGVMLSLLALDGLSVETYRFTIIGDGPQRKALENFVAEKGLNVRFLGRIERRELGNYYNVSDLFLFPSLHDSGGMVVLEAKLYNLPVVVSSFGGPKQFVDEHDFIIKSSNLEDFIIELRDIIINAK